jgi:hypothetical protein
VAATGENSVSRSPVQLAGEALSKKNVDEEVLALGDVERWVLGQKIDRIRADKERLRYIGRADRAEGHTAAGGPAASSAVSDGDRGGINRLR